MSGLPIVCLPNPWLCCRQPQGCLAALLARLLDLCREGRESKAGYRCCSAYALSCKDAVCRLLCGVLPTGE